MVDGRVECPLLLGSGERAKSPVQFHYMPFIFISRFHSLVVLEVEKTGLNIDFLSGFGSGGGRFELSFRC